MADRTGVVFSREKSETKKSDISAVACESELDCAGV